MEIRSHRLLALGTLLFLTLLTFAGAVGNDFVWDDRGYILDTPELLHPENVKLLVSPELYFSRFQEGSWRPVVTLSHFISVGLFGYWAPGHNLLDLFLYLLVVILVYSVAVRMGMSGQAAFIASAVFAVHPVHVEPVLVSALRADTLCALFILLAFLLQMKADELARGGSWLAGSVGLFFMGLLSKEVALVYPFLLLAYDVIRARQGAPWPKASAIVKRYALIMIVTGTYLLLRFGLFAGPPHSTSYVGGSPAIAALSMLGILAQYARLLLLPIHLNADYVVRPVASVLEPRALVGLAFLALLVLWALLFYRKRHLAGFCLAWLLFTLLPVSNLVPLDNPMAERYLFIPSIGFCWAVGLFLSGALYRLPSDRRYAMVTASWGVFALILLTLSLRTVSRVKDWRDELTLWRITAASSPESARAHLNLGSALLLGGRWEEGRVEIEKALAIEPNSAQTLHDLGLIGAHEGDWARAEQAYKRSLALQPDAAPTLYSLANALLAQGKTQEAMGALEKAISAKPLFAEAYVLQGNIMMSQGKTKDAAQAYRRAVEAAPRRTPDAYTNLGNAERALGNMAAAEDAYLKAIEIRPASAEAHFNLASLYGQQARYREAIGELEQAVKADQDMVVAHKNLGVFYLKVIRDEAKARFHFQRVLEIDPNHAEAPAIRQLLKSLPSS